MKLTDTLKTLRVEDGLSMEKAGLHHRRPTGAVRLVRSFNILGLCRSADGSIVGIAIERRDKKCLVPMAAIRDARKLADYLERIGLVAPTESKDLKLVAKYVDAVARCSTNLALTTEGIHRVANGDTNTFVAVAAGEVIGSSTRRVIPVLDAPSVYASSGDLPCWNATFAPLLEDNPLMLLAVCFGLSAPLAAILDFKPMGLLIAGPSSTGKTTLAKFVMSLYREPGDPHQWSGTGNGIEALAVQHRDLPLVIDELGAGGAQSALEVIYRVSGGISKARAMRTGLPQAPEVIRTPIFATGEVTLQHHANMSGQTVRAGHDARMPTIQVDEAYGVYSDIGDALDGAAFSAMVTSSMRGEYGTVMPAFIAALLADPDKVQRQAVRLRGKLEADVAGCEVITLSGLERRVLDGFVNYALAGELAIRFGVLGLERGIAKRAVGHVYRQWLERWRGSSNEALDAPIACLRDALKLQMNSFVPLKDWAAKDVKNIPGYTKTTPNEGTFFLIYPSVFERMCNAHGVEGTVMALRHEGHLVTDKKGQTKLVQMPGRSRDQEGSRMAFYAVRERIIFDA